MTVSRGSDAIDRPYLALLASMTPADLKPHTRRGSALWGDGFLARFALIAPPSDQRIELQDFPEGKRIIPHAVLEPLRRWHERLGMPQVTLEEHINDKGERTGVFSATMEAFPLHCCTFGGGVRAAVSTYRRALHDLLQNAGDDNTDLDGNYARLPIKALRIAALLASLENNGCIELRHWARAQQITERWRANVHHLVAQLADEAPTRERTAEDRILAFLQRHGDWLTPRIVAQGIRGLSTSEIKAYLDRMRSVGLVEAQTTVHTTKYRALPVQVCRRVDRVDVLTQPKNVYTPSQDTPPVAAQNASGATSVDKTTPLSTPSTRLHVYASDAEKEPTPTLEPCVLEEAIQAFRSYGERGARTKLVYLGIWPEERLEAALDLGVTLGARVLHVPLERGVALQERVELRVDVELEVRSARLLA